MKALPMEAARQVEAACGWLGLGDWGSANDELEEIAAELRAHPEVLDVRWRVYAATGKLDEAAMIAKQVMVARPERRAETLYGLAVAACRLKRWQEGQTWIAEAMELGGKKMKLRALVDPALAGV